jgi:putative transposase
VHWVRLDSRLGTERACHRRFRCRACGKQFNERSESALNRTQYPSDVIALVVLWRLRYKLSLRDLPEMFLIRGIVFSHEAVRDWEAKLTPGLAEGLRHRRRGRIGKSRYVDETYIKVHGIGAISIAPLTATACWST